jgi:hypothetical protein
VAFLRGVLSSPHSADIGQGRRGKGRAGRLTHPPKLNRCMLIKSCPKLRPAGSRRRRPRGAGCCEGSGGRIVKLTCGKQTRSGAGCAITRPRRHPAIGWPPRLERSAVSIAKRDGVEDCRCYEPRHAC